MTWNNVNLSDVAEIFNGKTPSKAEQMLKGNPILKIKDISETGDFIGKYDCFVDDTFLKKFQNKIIREGDTLILNAAHNSDYVASKFCYATTEIANVIPTGEWMIVRAQKSRSISRYIHYFLISHYGKFQIKKKVKGIHLYPKDISNIQIPLPPLDVQKKIAAVLDKADRLRQLRKQAIEKLDQLSQSVFLDMFGDPVTNPKGWEKRKLSEVCVKITDGTHLPPKFEEKGIPFIFVSNIVNYKLNLNSKKFISLETFYELTKRNPIELNDLLYTIVGSYGNPSIVHTKEKFCFQRHIAHLKPDSKKINYLYLFGMLKTPMIKKQADIKVLGVAQKTLNLKDLRNFDILLPPMELQVKFADIIKAIDDQKEKMKHSLTQLDSLFNSLMQRAFKGELVFPK